VEIAADVRARQAWDLVGRCDRMSETPRARLNDMVEERTAPVLDHKQMAPGP
jgi:hypothetical protein